MATRKKKPAPEATSTLAGLADREYGTLETVGHDGKKRKSKGNGDAIQKALLVYVAGGGDLSKVVKANGLADRLDPFEYDNQGLFRMSLGNSLRGLVRAGTPVVVGDVTVKSLDQRVAVPEAVEKKARAKRAA